MPSLAPAHKHRLILALLLLAAMAATLFWVRLGIPVKMADAPSGRIACVSYAPFYKEGEAPYDPKFIVTAERIEQDLRALSQRFDCVRTYSVGKGMDQVPRIARKVGMKVLLGVWLNRNPKDNAEEMAVATQLAQEEKAAGVQTIKAIIVGNEVLLRGELPQTKLAEHIRAMREATSLPVTYADVWEFWLKYREVEKAVDFVTIHILPYWEDRPVAVEDAVDHVRNILERMQAAFPDKQFLIGETGWPSAGRQRWGAVPSVVNEARFLREFLVLAEKEKINYNVIEAFDQPWKRGLEGTVGGYWGIFNSQLEAKFPMTGPVIEEVDWMKGPIAGLLLAVLFVVLARAAKISKYPTKNLRSTAVLALSGYATGAILAAQWRHMEFANRFATEWVITGFWGILALITTAWIAFKLARWMDQANTALLPPLPAVADFNTAPDGIRWLGVLRAMWLFAAVVVDLLLVYDARYRDFPTLLFAPAMTSFILLALISYRAPLGIEEKLMAAAIAIMGIVVVILELPINGSAVLWVLFGWSFAAAIPVWHKQSQ